MPVCPGLLDRGHAPRVVLTFFGVYKTIIASTCGGPERLAYFTPERKIKKFPYKLMVAVWMGLPFTSSYLELREIELG